MAIQKTKLFITPSQAKNYAMTGASPWLPFLRNQTTQRFDSSVVPICFATEVPRLQWPICSFLYPANWRVTLTAGTDDTEMESVSDAPVARSRLYSSCVLRPIYGTNFVSNALGKMRGCGIGRLAGQMVQQRFSPLLIVCTYQVVAISSPRIASLNWHDRSASGDENQDEIEMKPGP